MRGDSLFSSLYAVWVWQEVGYMRVISSGGDRTVTARCAREVVEA